MDVEELARRLDRHLGLLGAGRRMAPSRHKTMRKAIDWSYNLLTKPERLLLRRLSVFWGGWTLEAAEAVCSEEGIDRREVVERLSRLIDQCLVLYEPARGSGRYRLPEPIRQYGLEKLSPRAETRLRDRHLDHFLALAEQAEPKLFTREQVAWVDPLEADHDNLLAALEWSRTAARGSERGLRLAGALTRFWIIRSYLTEGRQWLKETLERNGPASEPVMAKALTGAAALAYFQSDYSGAAPLLDEAIRRARQVGDPWLTAFSTSLRGYTAQFQGDAQRATALFQESLAIARKAGDTWNEAIALSGPALQAYFKGDYEESQAFNGKAVTLFRAVGERVAIIYPLLLLGHMSRRRGEYDRAGAYYQEGLAHAERVENKRCMEMCLYGLASVCLSEGQPARAARLLGAAEAVREAIHAPVPPMWRAEYDQIINETRAAMTQDAFAGPGRRDAP
jgi:tetratricopeptide (TPR) repeat protein